MEIIKKFNPLTGTYEYYNIITHEWVVASQGGLGLFDSLVSGLTSIASKATSDVAMSTAKKLAETTAKQALKSASKKAGDELGRYAVVKIKDKVTRHKTPHPNLIVKKLHKMDEPIILPPPKRLYRGGRIKRIFKKYNI